VLTSDALGTAVWRTWCEPVINNLLAASLTSNLHSTCFAMYELKLHRTERAERPGRLNTCNVVFIVGRSD